MTPGQGCPMFIMYLQEHITLNDINLIVYALLRKAKYMITPVPNRGNQSFMNEPINHQQDTALLGIKYDSVELKWTDSLQL